MTTPPRLAHAAGHGYAADNARRDGIHLVALSCGRLADGNAGGHQEAAQTSQQAGNGERGNADGSGVDAGNAGRLKIAAAGINTPSVNRFGQNECTDDDNDYKKDGQHRDACDRGGSDRLVFLC